MILTDKYAYINRMAGIHPQEKIAFTFIMFIGTFLSSSFTTLLCISLFMASILILKAAIPTKFLFRLYALPFFFLIPAVFAIAIQPTDLNEAVWAFQLAGNSLGITAEGLSTALFLTMRVLAALSCFYFLILTTPLTDILLFLKKLRLPELLLELTSLTYRFIFLVMDTSDRIRISQESRLGTLTIKNRLRSISLLMSNLLLLTMDRSDSQFIAMEARCYNGSFHLLEKEAAFSVMNILAIVALAGILICIEVITRGAW